MSKPTPGPWLRDGHMIFVIEGDEKRLIAIVDRAEDINPVSAVPELLELLKSAVERCAADDEVWLNCAWVKDALGAIAKAEGKP